MFFRRKKLLFEHDPEKLSLELLSTLQGALMAKLVVVNAELERRYRKLADLSTGIPNGDNSGAVMAAGANQVAALNDILKNELAKRASPVIQTETA